MRAARAIGVSALALLAAVGIGVGVLLMYYRPTIEYAYIDIVDKSETAMSGWWLLFGAVVLVGMFWFAIMRLLKRGRV